MANEVKQNAAGSVASLVLGICSIVFSCGIVGLILGIIGLAQAKKANALIAADPALGGAGLAKGGKITSIIGIVFGAIAIFYWVVVVFILGAAATELLAL